MAFSLFVILHVERQERICHMQIKAFVRGGNESRHVNMHCRPHLFTFAASVTDTARAVSARQCHTMKKRARAASQYRRGGVDVREGYQKNTNAVVIRNVACNLEIRQTLHGRSELPEKGRFFEEFLSPAVA